MNRQALPLHAGISLKPEYYAQALQHTERGLWFEIHPENYMVAGGPRLAWLHAIGADHPLSFHGVGMSLAGSEPLDQTHLARLAELVERYQPASVSEHLAWCRHNGQYFADLLPVLRTPAALTALCNKIDAVQQTLGRSILLENPTHYVDLEGHSATEPDFLSEVVARTGCGLLVDINNLFLSQRNIGLDTRAWLAGVPIDAIGEFHLAGHTPDPAYGEHLLIDTHDCSITADVWDLFAEVLALTGPRPTLIERDGNLPPFAELLSEREQAERLLRVEISRLGRMEVEHHA